MNTMDVYMQAEADGLPMRESGPWVAEKLDYLERYVNTFETSMRNKWGERHYIDLFAGPGKCTCQKTGSIHLGSPLVALTTRYPFTGYFFVDSDVTMLDALKQRCRASPLHTKIRFFVDDANAVAQRIVDEIRGRPSLNLAFLDPEGLELQWNTVATLAEVGRMDLIIHYPQMGLNRNVSKMYQTTETNIVDQFFGDADWRETYEKHVQHGEQFLHRNLIDHYRAKLENLGYVSIVQLTEAGTEPLITNEKNAPLYRLLFASKHQLGNDFWQRVTSRNRHGQRRLI